MDSIVELQDIPVMKVKANMNGKGPSEAMQILESKLPSLKGRKFYGAFFVHADGSEDYYACVQKIDSDDPAKMSLETGLIPAGKYARRKITGWERIIREGKLPGVFDEFANSHRPNLVNDPERPSLEFYRSHEELILFVPVKSSTVT
jgi:hypothetical protein